MKKMGITPKPFRSRLLVFVPLLAALYMFVWPTALRFFTKPKDAPLIPQFTNHLVTSDFWATFPPVAVAVPFLFICGFMTVYFLGSKGFCTYACPYGGFFVLADKVAPGKIRVTDACNQCGHCTAVCTSNVMVHAEVKEYGMVVDPGCMKCMDCVSVCPNDALYFGFGKPSIAVAKSPPKHHPLTWGEEVAALFVFAASYWAAWDVYQLVPMLMALGIASRHGVPRSHDVEDASGPGLLLPSVRPEGVRPACEGRAGGLPPSRCCGSAVNAHSGWVRHHESAGNRAFEGIQVPDELALARANPDPWLSPTDRRNIASGKRHLHAARDAGLVVNSDALPKLAWLEYLSGNSKDAVDLLATAAEHQRGQGRALSLYYRGAILNRLGRHQEALASLDQALTERSDLVLAREERGESLWQLGRRQEAVSAWTDAVASNAGLVLANNLLAGAAWSLGRPEAAIVHETRADQYTPENPFFHWMVGLRLQGVGMAGLAEKHFRRAIDLDPGFRSRLEKTAG